MNQFSFLFSPTAQALGYTLLYSLWQAFVIFICLRLILKYIPHASARIKYAISGFAYLGIATWFAITLIQQLSLQQSEFVYGEIMRQIVLQKMVYDQPVANTSAGLSLSFLNMLI